MQVWPEGRVVTFQDANFRRKLTKRFSRLEGESLRWTPFGMPRLNWVLERSVFFLYGRNPRTSKIEGPLGTGVFIGIEAKTAPFYIRHIYAISCWHVVHKTGASIIRLNTRDGKSRLIELEPTDWEFPPGGDDLAIADVSERLNTDTDEISCLPYSLFATKQFIENDHLGIGEDGFMLGLFAENPGEHRNLVAARFGNISLLAADDAPVTQPNGIKRPSHVFDMRSRPGFSGSPVFVYRTPAGDLRTATERGRDKNHRRQISVNRVRPTTGFVLEDWQEERDTHDNTFLMLLGVHAGQYPEAVPVSKVRTNPAESDDYSIRDGDRLRIPSSMTVVVPVWEIENLLLSKTLTEQREARDAAMDKKRNNVPDAEAIETDVSESSPPANGGNPNHREDFTHLVGAAARRPAPKD